MRLLDGVSLEQVTLLLNWHGVAVLLCPTSRTSTFTMMNFFPSDGLAGMHAHLGQMRAFGSHFFPHVT